MSNFSRRTRSSLNDNDSGFTLVELLISLIIMPLIVGALTMMMLTVFKGQSGITNRTTGAGNSQVAEALMVRDVQSADYLTTQSSPSCGSAGTQILGLKSQGNQVVISYVRTTNGSSYRLFRQLCVNSVTSTPSTTTLISDNVPATQAADVSCAVTITCSPSTTWLGTEGISSVTVTVNETRTGASYSMSAVPRTWSAMSAGYAVDISPITPLLLLGNGTCPQTTLALTGSTIVTVANGSGDILSNSTCASSFSMVGSGTISAAHLYTADPTPATALSKTGSGVAPVPQFHAVTPDPLAAMVAPATPTASGSVTCPAVSGKYTCAPGNYASALSFTGSGTATFAGGTYVFTQPVSIAGSVAATFGSGTYLFQQGLSVTGSGNLIMNSGTYIFGSTTATSTAFSVSGTGDVTTGPGGVLFYVKSGVVSFSGNGNITISGRDAYNGVDIWQASTDTNAITLVGSTCVNGTYGGIYAPKAAITPVGSSSVSAAFMIVNSLSFTGSSELQVG